MHRTALVVAEPARLFDTIIAGGGPAGLSAGLMLGRCRRRVLICDLGAPRNRRSHALHGYLTRDAIAPSDFNAIGRDELKTYGVAYRQVGVADAQRIDRGFRVRLTDGSDEITRFLLLATGVIDELPAVGGIDDCYGHSVFHCPYCDGWEWRDRRLSVLGRAKQGPALALSLKTWSPDVVLCTNGSRIPPDARERLERNAIVVRTDRLASLEHDGGALKALAFENGEKVPRDALFFSTAQHPQCDLAVRLGCLFNRRGTVNTGSLCNTNIDRVFVAGDASRDAQFVVVAAAEGAKAALAINQALQREDLVP